MKRLRFNHVEFVKSAKKPADYPSISMPEIAVVGRSNVGKSTLLNHLFQSKRLVKTSSTPGKTQLLNFFSVDQELMCVDLPGYGYAQADTSEWDTMISTYLKERECLRLILLLLDIRRIPTPQDIKMAEWLRSHGHATLLILTKIDKVKKSAYTKQTESILSALHCKDHPHIHYSATHHTGRSQLISWIVSCLS